MRLTDHGHGVITGWHPDHTIHIRHLCLDGRDTNWQQLLPHEYKGNPWADEKLELVIDLICGLCTLRGTIRDGRWVPSHYSSIQRTQYQR